MIVVTYLTVLIFYIGKPAYRKAIYSYSVQVQASANQLLPFEKKDALRKLQTYHWNPKEINMQFAQKWFVVYCFLFIFDYFRLGMEKRTYDIQHHVFQK
jgi:hypothetical protein